MKRMIIGLLFVAIAVNAFGSYNPGQGRWLSRDPVGEVGGLNLYSYVRNEPVNRIDPLGLQSPTALQLEILAEKAR